MPVTYAGFVDVGYLRAEGAKSIGKRSTEVRLNASAAVDWLRGMRRSIVGSVFLRAYWYDGAFDPSHKEYVGQRRYFDAIARAGNPTAIGAYRGAPVSHSDADTASARKNRRRTWDRPRGFAVGVRLPMDFLPRPPAKGRGHANRPGHGPPCRTLSFLDCGPDSVRPRPG